MKSKYVKLLDIIFLLILFLFTSSDQAHAYLDPGSGSFILQIIIASFVGGLFAVKTFWLQIKSSFTRLFSRKKKEKKPDSARMKKNGKK